jgi:hypothetical protein
MSRSDDFPGLPGKLGDEVLLELLPGACAAAARAGDRRGYRGRCPACLDYHWDAIGDHAIPSGAVVAALVRRGWAARVARRHVEYDALGLRYRHVPRGYGSPTSFRAWRRRAKVLVGAGRADDIVRWRYDRGRSYW